MGITGEIVKNVFARGKQQQQHHHHRHLHTTHSAAAARIARAEKKRWKASVRSYLCGDHDQDHDSVITDIDYGEVVSVRSSTVAEAGLDSFRSNRAANISISTNTWDRGDADAASVRSSEATVNQPLDGNPTVEIKEARFEQEDAALIIQSAFRTFQAKRARDEAERHGNRGSPSKESIGTSIEVQTGNSSDIFSIKEGSFDLRHTLRHRSKSQVLKIQEDWDDSTVSSVISKMRIRNKMEAATRRERALAYAFSQQLRVCSKRKQCTPKGDETSTASWTWLERWMAARQPEMVDLMDGSIADGVKATACKKIMDGSVEEKESCGSNEVSMLFENGFTSVLPKNVPRPHKVLRTKATRSLCQQNSTSSYFCPKDVKKVQHLEDEKEKRKRARQPSLGNKKDMRNTTTTNQLPMEHNDVQSISIN